MTSRELALLIRNVLAGEPHDPAEGEDLTVTGVLDNGHGMNFLVSNPDGDRFRVIITSP